MAQPTLKNPPAVTSPAPPPANKRIQKKITRFIEILQDDHNFDIIQEIVDHMGVIKRSKKLKPLEKHRMLMNYHVTLLSFCVPKMKIIEDDTRDTVGKGVVFHINIGGSDDKDAGPASAGQGKISKDKRKGVSITIPTVVNDEGTYEVKE